MAISDTRYKDTDSQDVTCVCGKVSAELSGSPAMQDCGHKFWNKHEAFQFHGVLATSVPNLKFEPQAHVYCADTTAEALKGFKNDGLPKFAQQQPVAGGDGRKIAL